MPTVFEKKKLPTFFEIVKQVLDRSYAEIEDQEKDKKIVERLEQLSKQFSNVLAQGGPTYEDRITRFAYVFRYATAHADYLNTLIGSSKELQACLQNQRIDISCIGGGPGSDVLGFLKFLLAKENAPQISYFILDKEPAWVETWSDLDLAVSEQLKTSRSYVPIDVTEPKSYEKYSRPYKADIFTMVYFLSEVFRHKDATSVFLTKCFSEMKQNAPVAVLDFHDSGLESWTDGCAKTSGFETVFARQDRFTLDPQEEKNVLKAYTDKFGAPKLQAQLFMRVFRKP